MFVHDADIESDPAENEDDDLLAVDGQGDAGNPIQDLIPFAVAHFSEFRQSGQCR